jgi:hypothetical protein
LRCDYTNMMIMEKGNQDASSCLVSPSLPIHHSPIHSRPNFKTRQVRAQVRPITAMSLHYIPLLLCTCVQPPARLVSWCRVAFYMVVREDTSIWHIITSITEGGGGVTHAHKTHEHGYPASPRVSCSRSAVFMHTVFYGRYYPRHSKVHCRAPCALFK